MHKNLLRNLNFLIYLVLCLLFFVFQTTIFRYFPLNYFQPDFMLILSIYLGFKRDNIEGGILILLASIMMQSLSSAGDNFFIACYIYAFVISKVISRTIVVPNRASIIFISAGLNVLWKLGILLLLGLESKTYNGVRHFFSILIPSTLTQGFFAPLLFTWFNHIDLMTFKDSHSEDEYDINKEF